MADKTAEYQRAADLYKQALAEGADPQEAQSAYNAAVSAIAKRVDTPVASPAQKPAERASWTPAPGGVDRSTVDPKQATGIMRAGAQGATFGFADELEAGARALSPDVTYGDAVHKIRDENASFAAQHPGLNFGAEVAGGLLTGGALRSAAKATTKSLAGRAAAKAAEKLGSSAFLQGAAAGAGAGEGGVGDRALSAAMGGAVGGTVGGLAGKAAAKIERLRSRVSDGVQPWEFAKRKAQSAVANKVGEMQGGVDALALAGDANAAQGAKIIDNMGREGMRMARGIRTQGGPAGDMMEDAMASRARLAPERVTDALYNGKSIENIVRETDDFIEAARVKSDPLYEVFRKEPPANDPRVEELLETPLFKKAIAAAEDYAANDRKPLLYTTNAAGDKIPLRSPEFLDNVKKRLDDIISKGRKQTGEGGFAPGQLGQAQRLKAEYVEMLDDIYPKTYKIARDTWSGEIALKNAMEDGQEAARNRMMPEQLAKDFAALTTTEREVFRRGYLDQLRQSVENGGLKPSETEHRAFIKRVETVFDPADAQVMLTRLRDETQATRLSQKLLTQSESADKAAELPDDYMRGGVRALASPRFAGASLADRLLGTRVFAPLNKQANIEKAKLLLSPADDAEVLKRIAGELRAQKRGRTVRKVVSPLAAETSYGMFRRPAPVEDR